MAVGNTVEAVIGAKLAPSFTKSFLQAEKTSKRLGDAVDRLSTKAAAAKGVKDLKGSLDRASLSLKDAEKRLASINRRIDSGEEQTDKLVNSWIEAETRVESARKEFKKLENQMEKSNREAKKLDTSTDRLAESHTELQNQLGRTTRMQQRYNRQMSRANDLQDEAGKLGMAAAGTAAAGYAMSRIVAAPIRTGMEFEAATSDVLSIANQQGNFETLEEAQTALVDRIKELGATTSFTGSEVASAAKFLTMAGYDIGKTIEALPATLNLARAGGLDLGQTADIVSNIMTPFNLAASETGRVTDVMAQVITTSNTDIAMLGDTMRYVAPAASALGLSLEESAAMAGLLGNSGIQASQAGTTMRAMFQRLAAPVGKANDIISELGITLTDAEGNLRNPVQLLGEFGEAMDNAGYGTAQQLAAISHVFGQEAMAGAKTIMDAAKANGESTSDALSTYIQQVQESAGSGLAQSIAETQLDNLQGDLTMLGSAVDGAFVTMYDNVKPILRAVVSGITSVVGGINEWMNEHPALTKAIGATAMAVTTLTIGAAALLGTMSAAKFGASLWVRANAALALSNTKAAASTGFFTKVTTGLVGGLNRTAAAATRATASINGFTIASAKGKLAAIGSSMSGMFTKVTAGAASFAPALIGAGVALKGLGAAALTFMATNPIGWIIGAVAALGFAVYKYWEPIKSFGQGVFSGLGDTITEFKNALAPVGDAIGAVFGAIGEVFSAIGSLFAPVDSTADGLDKANQAGVGFGKALGVILTPLKLVAHGIGFLASGLAWVITGIGKVAGGIIRTVGGVVGAIFDIVTWPFKAIYNVVSGTLSAIGAVVSGVYNVITYPFRKVHEFVTWMFSDTEEQAEESVGGIGAAFSAIGSVLTWPFRMAKKIITGIFHGIGKAVEIITAPVRAVGNFIVGVFGGIWDVIEAPVTELGSAIGNVFYNVGRTILGLVTWPFRKMLELGGMAVDGLKAIFAPIGKAIAAPFKAAYNFVSDKFSAAIGMLMTPINAVKDAFGTVKDVIGSAADAIMAPFRAIGDFFADTENMGKRVGEAIGDFFMAPLEGVTDFISGIGDSIAAVGDWLWGDDEEGKEEKKDVRPSTVTTPSGNTYQRQGNVLSPQFGQQPQSAPTPMLQPVQRAAGDGLSPYAQSRDRTMAATSGGGDGTQYVYRTQSIDSVEIRVDGGGSPTDTADEVMRRFDEEAQRRERELVD